MLYDKRWDAKVQADPFSLESLIAWLEQQPPEQEYNFRDPSICMLGQFASAKGEPRPAFKSCDLDARPGWGRVAFGDDCEGPWTFGAALQRARELAAANS